MSEQITFADFMDRIRSGDEQAAAELVERYAPVIRREVRWQLQDPSLCRLFDSMDICQSVLGSFFARSAGGQFDLDRPDQLARLLVTMARNKLASAVRRQHRQRRDSRRTAASVPTNLDQLPAKSADPDELAAGTELLVRIRENLTDEERRLADLRGQGVAWADIAAEMGGTPQARRVQLARAVERVMRQLSPD